MKLLHESDPKEWNVRKYRNILILKNFTNNFTLLIYSLYQYYINNFLSSDIAPDSPFEIPNDMPDYMALAYLALNDQVIQFQTKMMGAETHLEAMLCIQQAISYVSRKKALRIKHELLEKDFKSAYGGGY